MKTFAIENESNNITAHPTAKEAESVARVAAPKARKRRAAPVRAQPQRKPHVAPVKATPKRKATASKKSKAPPRGTRPGSKTEKILSLLKRPGGASLKELMKATGWQAHSVRGFVSGTLGKKMSLTVVSIKSEDGERSYSLKG
jgi:hypothetical protein